MEPKPSHYSSCARSPRGDETVRSFVDRISPALGHLLCRQLLLSRSQRNQNRSYGDGTLSMHGSPSLAKQQGPNWQMGRPR